MPGTTAPVPPSVLREASRIVETEPAIEAIILFGSRARGDHHRESDVDLAVVSTAPHREVWDACRSLTEASEAVQVVPVDPAALRTYRNTANRVERSVVVDGEALAGTWHRPPHRREATEMDHDAFANGLRRFTSHAKSAISDIAEAKELGDDGTNSGTFNAFRAGEHAAKAVLTLYGLTPRKIHGVTELAKQLRNARQGAPDQPERETLAGQIDELNGNADKLNKADYDDLLVERMDATERRLTLAARLAERCVDLHARQATAPSRKPTTPPDAHARALKRIASTFHGSPESLHKHPSRGRLSPETNAAIESVCTRAAVAAEAQAHQARADMAEPNGDPPTHEMTDPDLDSPGPRDPSQRTHPDLGARQSPGTRPRKPPRRPRRGPPGDAGQDDGPGR